MKDFFEESADRENIFDCLMDWFDKYFELISNLVIVILSVGLIAFFAYSIKVSQKPAEPERLWDLPINKPGEYVRTDPDTGIEYIIVISDSAVSVHKRKLD